MAGTLKGVWSQEGIKKGYAQIVKGKTKQGLFTCCEPDEGAKVIGQKIGYSQQDLDQVPQDSNLGIGCGNPLAFTGVQNGMTVLDLGSGAGFDCFLASRAVGDSGKVIGVDFTPAMVKKADENKEKGGYSNVEFRHGSIEDLPVADSTIDLVISNCVINLVQNKTLAFKEAFRVLKSGGRITVSDIVLRKELPDFVRSSIAGYIACVAGAVTQADYLESLESVGFSDIKIEKSASFPLELMLNDPIAQKIIEDFELDDKEVEEISSSVLSITVTAKRK